MLLFCLFLPQECRVAKSLPNVTIDGEYSAATGGGRKKKKTFFQIFICFKHFYIFVAPKWEGRSTVEECYLIVLLLRASSIKLQASKMPRWQGRANGKDE